MRYWKVILGVVLVALIAAGSVFAVFYYNDNKKPNFTKEYVLYVRPGTPVSEILDSLESGAGALNMRSLERVFSKMDVASKMQPGRYVVDPTCPSIYVARMLVFGWQTPAKMTL
jgi:cell division protein YceG involved in septum cleavage